MCVRISTDGDFHRLLFFAECPASVRKKHKNGIIQTSRWMTVRDQSGRITDTEAPGIYRNALRLLAFPGSAGLFSDRWWIVFCLSMFRVRKRPQNNEPRSTPSLPFVGSWHRQKHCFPLCRPTPHADPYTLVRAKARGLSIQS